jgi:nucleoid-associated protein YgaU
VLIAVFYFSGISDKPVVEKSAKKMEAAKQEQDKAQTEQVTEKIEQPKAETEQVMEKIEQPNAETEQPKVEAEQDKAQTGQSLPLTPLTEVQTEQPRPAEKSRTPLELEIPKNMPQVDIDEYVVVKGDTLWGISKRYTGNPYNYPRIAGENRIADPDVIIPGQKIRLIK